MKSKVMRDKAIVLLTVFFITSSLCSNAFAGKLQLPNISTEEFKKYFINQESYKIISLRSRNGTLTTKDIKRMLKDYGFFDFLLHPQRTFVNRFTDYGDGTITDMATGLLWQKGGSEVALNFMDAEAYVETLNKQKLAGRSEWRLPTIEELASLMEVEKINSDLYISTLFNTIQKKCWSADNQGVKTWSGTKKNENIWVINFIEGVIFFDFLKGGNNYYVKAVCKKQ